MVVIIIMILGMVIILLGILVIVVGVPIHTGTFGSPTGLSHMDDAHLMERIHQQGSEGIGYVVSRRAGTIARLVIFGCVLVIIFILVGSQIKQ
jgi:hypothetical protein